MTVIGTRIDEAGTLIRDGVAFYLRRNLGGRYDLELHRTPVNFVENGSVWLVRWSARIS